MDLKKRKKMVFVATALLIVCTILLTSSSYAWIVLSQVPEITGMSTVVGANGSLEIALLSGKTFTDPTQIKTMIGGSMEAQDPRASNVQWGNILDLSDSSYGLNEVTLIPAKLQVDSENLVGDGLLFIPGYGMDGRFTGFADHAVTGVYVAESTGEGVFQFDPEKAEYGVRGIGSVKGITAQESALSGARAAVETCRVSARTGMITLWEENGSGLMSVLAYRYGGSDSLDLEQTVQVLEAAATDLLEVLDYLDSGLRYSIVGYAAMHIENESAFKQAKELFLYKQRPLSSATANLTMELPSLYSAPIQDLEKDIANMRYVVECCGQYKAKGTMDATIQELTDLFFGGKDTFLNEKVLADWSNAPQMEEDNVLTTVSHTALGAAMHTVGCYVGDYSVFCNYNGKSVELATLTVQDEEPILVATYNAIKNDEPKPSGDIIELNEVYGYVIDMAFRCNINTDLLLQTAPRNRVEDGSDLDTYEGSGSHMRFRSEQLSEQQVLLMMDAVRIGFLDNMNHLLGVAKLNTSNYELTPDGVEVPLYLYDYEVLEDGCVQIGQRRSENNTIIAMHENTPVVISVVVWLDGDYVNNSLAAIRDQSIVGVLNLQFASSTDLQAGFSETPQPSDTDVQN